MNRSIQPVSSMEQTSSVEPVPEETFDYASLEAEVAQQVQAAAHRIHESLKRTVENILAVGTELLVVKQALPHGCFGVWLRAEFGLSDKSARNFMMVAERFGGKTEIISDLPIDPTAAYLLAAPSVPEEASEAALQRAKNGERITVSAAREILDAVRRKPVQRARKLSALPARQLLGELLESLETYRRRWDPQQLSLLARELREFADSLEER